MTTSFRIHLAISSIHEKMSFEFRFWAHFFAFQNPDTRSKIFRTALKKFALRADDDTRSWLIEQFNEWQVFDVQTQKWKSLNVNGGDYTDLMKRFTTKFPKAEGQLTEKQIRLFFSRLRKKIKTRVNEETSQNIIDDKVREEVVKELMKIKEKFACTMDTDQTSSSPGETKEVSRKRPESKRSRRKVKRVKSTQQTRSTSVRRHPVRRARQRPRRRTSRRRVSCKKTSPQSILFNNGTEIASHHVHFCPLLPLLPPPSNSIIYFLPSSHLKFHLFIDYI